MVIEIRVVFVSRGGGLTRHEEVSWREGNVLYFDWDGSYMVYMFLKTHQIVQLRSVCFIIYKLFLNLKSIRE